MRRFVALVAALTIGVGALTGCSGTEAYCKALKDNASATENPEQMAAAMDKMRSIQDKAPTDVKGNWDRMIAFLDKWQAAKADTSKAGELAEEAAKMEGDFAGIAKHAKEACGIELS